MRIAVVVDTRPEAIKLAPVAKLLGREALVVHTGQHYSAGMSGQIAPDIVLDARDDRDISRGHQLGNLVTALDHVFALHEPDVVLVQGDTTSALAGALAANANAIPLVHLEAGLRSFDRAMPEEHHRVLIDHLADLCCAPTPLARDNLLAERIELTGNTIVEAVIAALPSGQEQARILGNLGLAPGGFVLATIHRPENADHPVNLAAILRQLAGSPLPVVFPLHPRTRQHIGTFGLTDLARRLCLTEPLGYPVLLTLIQHAIGLVTDSGGIQEEATILKRPILVVRRSNERPEAEQAFGCRKLPTDEGITRILATWLHNAPRIHSRLADLATPFGDGTAPSHLVRAIRTRFGDKRQSTLPTCARRKKLQQQ